MPISEEKLLNVFFEGHLRGYANDHLKPGKIIELPRTKIVKHEIDGMIFADHWRTTALSRCSWGETELAVGDDVFWMMQYWGTYPDSVIPFLREALATAYLKKHFIGGRGPHHFSKGEYVYTNVPMLNHLDRFAGMEVIKNDQSKQVLGWHKYHGRRTDIDQTLMA